MLLQLDNTSKDNLKKLMDYAHQLNINLSLVDDSSDNPALPGKPLSVAALKSLIEKNRASDSIDMTTAHNILRKKFNADHI